MNRSAYDRFDDDHGRAGVPDDEPQGSGSTEQDVANIAASLERIADALENIYRALNTWPIK